jgi:uncharacterized protein YkwD
MTSWILEICMMVRFPNKASRMIGASSTLLALALWLMTTPLLLAQTPVFVPRTAPAAPFAQVQQSFASDVIRLTNQQRANYGLPALTPNAQLTAAATAHAQTMARVGTLCHQAGGTTLSGRVSAAGYSYGACGENIAYNYDTGPSVVQGWMNSPGHRANILNPTYRHIGVGYARDSQGHLYSAQVFGQVR